ncbi:MAG TPA: sodium:calcium antiporter [Phycisphaerales bacterium]|nr:sodium:calcium antiporter [Phycisphaerales bacterium]HCD33106.1 sodium:calcium antiporter [Phycisphaerales bacterium]|tara:strand:+ start:751 stop:1863 length:1113 start_codon:yes stop_codon:yes gene_type:complete
MEKLIPTEVFEAMPMFMLILVAIGSVWTLIRGADWLVDGAAGLAFRMGIPKVIVGATIVSLGTTSPETAVSVMAAWAGNAGLALGNAVGSIVADTGLIFGLGCAMVVLPADKFVLKRQGWVKIGSGVLLAVMCYVAWFMDGEAAQITRVGGILLLVLLVAYMFISVKWARQHAALDPAHAHPMPTGMIEETMPALAEDTEEMSHQSPWLLLLLLVVGLAVVVFASRFLVASATVMATRWGVPDVVIAATLVALGTSLPELMVGIASIVKGHRELLVGNVIGADILNVLFVIGASAVAKALPIVDPSARIPEIFLYMHLPTMLAMMALFLVYIFIAIRKGSFSRWMGYPLLVMYVAYVVLQFVLTAGGPSA